jgi:hypothetical protein
VGAEDWAKTGVATTKKNETVKSAKNFLFIASPPLTFDFTPGRDKV